MPTGLPAEAELPDEDVAPTAFTTPTRRTMGGAPLNTRQLCEGAPEVNFSAEDLPEK